MQKRIFNWLDREFVELTGEARHADDAAIEAREILQRFDQELRGVGMSLDNTVRTRLWARDRRSRDLGSEERVKLLSGKARSASSSFIAPARFDSDARIAVDLLAMRPAGAVADKQIKEYSPPIKPLRYLIWDSVVLLSGVTVVLPTLQEQMEHLLPLIEGSLNDAGSSWARTVRVSFLVHRSQSFDEVKMRFKTHVKPNIPVIEYFHVDGYSSEGKLIEIEVTATV